MMEKTIFSMALADNTWPSFFYSHNRHNEFNINLAYLKASYNNGDHFLWRTEIRTLHSADKIFIGSKQALKNNTAIITSIASYSHDRKQR